MCGANGCDKKGACGMNKNIFSSFTAVIFTSVLVACGGGGGGGGGNTNPVTPVAPVFNSALKPTDLPLDCFTKMYTRSALIDGAVSKEYGYENNSWGAWALYGGTALKQPWSQCVGVGFSDANTVVARMTWDTNGQTPANTLYPEIVYGFKPQPIQNNSPTFPKLITNISSLNVKWNFEIDKGNGAGQILLEAWLSSSPKVSDNHDGIVNAEVGIMLDCWGNDSWCIESGELVVIGGQDYIYKAARPSEIFGVIGSSPFTYFRSVKPQTGKGSLDMMQFINFLKSRNAIPNSLYLDSIEFGPEVSFGKGEVRVNSYSITVN